MRGETLSTPAVWPAKEFQSTPLMRGETGAMGTIKAFGRNFNPLPSCEGSPLSSASFRTSNIFQSTPLMRGETPSTPFRGLNAIFQSTPLMRGETGAVGNGGYLLPKFQSTPLMRGETLPWGRMMRAALISIHSPHARGDPLFDPVRPPADDFNPLPSCEGRRRSLIGGC